MEEKLKLKYPVIVEGRYDKAKVCNIVSTPVIALDGFSVFKNAEKQQLLKRLSREQGIIMLTDSDRAGTFLRAKLKGILKGTVYNVYAPAVLGKEKRKSAPSADGLLGVEGIDSNILCELLKPFANGSAPASSEITKTRFYADGFSGGNNSSERRKKLCKLLSLPENLSSKALLDAINLLVSESDYENAVKIINEE
ncbi:MAG: DUF4093 domain-containing protein [Clostridia bacterium]|nr:DUF4093 domain-containing protein [Clostridia bacterium]